MMKRMKTLIFLVVGGLLLVAVFVMLRQSSPYIDRRLNRVSTDPSAPIPTEKDLEFHESLFVVDLHADTLKWERDILERAEYGHVDLPRLIEGNVALQVFTIVTKSPMLKRNKETGQRCVSSRSFNTAAVVAALQGRPVWSIRERALYQIERLMSAAHRSQQRPGPELRLITNVEQLEDLIAARRAGKAVVGAILGIEGGHWVGTPGGPDESVVEDMQQLFSRGVRQFAPTHRFDNALSGASEGCERGGLTPQGTKALKTAEQLGMAVDLAHISAQGFDDAVQVLEKPFMVSHTGVAEGCEPPCRPQRNLSDRQIMHTLRHEGLIGVGYWPQAIGPSIWRIAESMQHIISLGRAAGIDAQWHVALGSDFDGSVTPFIEVSDLAVLTTVMRRSEYFTASSVRGIAGINACRFFARVLPGGSEERAAALCERIQLF